MAQRPKSFSRRAGKVCAALWLGALGSAHAARAETRAVVVGIDDYSKVTRLHGAVNDARDIAAVLAARGVRDLTTLIDAAASRDSVLAALENLVTRTRAGDLVVVSFAGHGNSETWGPKHPDDVKTGDSYEVFLLREFAPPPGDGHLTSPEAKRRYGERILGREMRVFFERLEKKGARTVFVADACHGGGLTRQSWPGASAPTYRSVPYPTAPSDEDPIAPQIAALPAKFDHLKAMPSLTFLAAVDSTMRSPEVDIPKGSITKRGALSYAFARLIEGSGDSDGNGVLTREEMFGFVRTTVREFADFKQTPELQPNDEAPGIRTRSVVDLRRDLSVALPPQTPSVVRTVRVFVDGPARSLPAKGRTGDVAIAATPTRPEADLIWNPARGIVLSKSGDLVAGGVAEAGLGAIAEREVALRELLTLSQARSPTALKLDGGDRLYCAGDDVRAIVGTVSDGFDKYLLFNVAGDGTVQFLGPQSERRDDFKLASNTPLFTNRVVPPFGTDTMVLVASRSDLTPLIAGVRALDGERMPLEAVARIKQAGGDVRITLQGLFTAGRQAQADATGTCSR